MNKLKGSSSDWHLKRSSKLKLWVEQPKAICYSIENNFETLGGGLFDIEIGE